MDSVEVANNERGGYFYTNSDTSGGHWHLRFGLTQNCNFKCRYCAPEGGFPKRPELPIEEVEGILRAAFVNGVKRVHWTGGEPTYRDDFEDCVSLARSIGFVEQIITTNGYKLKKKADVYKELGIDRFIISIDSLSDENFLNITKMKNAKQVREGIRHAALVSQKAVKLSICTMKSNIHEIGDFIDFASNLNRGDKSSELILKFNQFFPSNPAQLEKSGRSYFKSQMLDYDDIISELKKYGDLIPISRKEVIGDNPSYQYFELGPERVRVGVLAMYSWQYRCGGCHKLRVKPNGEISVCMDWEAADVSLRGKPLNKKISEMAAAIRFRENDLDRVRPINARRHYTPQLGGQRFGALGEAVQMDQFYKSDDDRA